ncbi:heparan-alpha-glucosaminide N-acetyltransferase domain-containing protein [Kineococcus sp. NUM-3379]
MATVARGPAAGRERLAGVDLARGLAVTGMVAVHLLPAAAGGAAGLVHTVAGGRASALFGVLAGVSLGLLTRRGLDGAGRRERAGLRAGVVVRALLVTLLGLVLTGWQEGIAVVLPAYGLAFLVLLPVLWWPARRLAVLAGAWLLLGPVAGHLLRQDLPPGPGPQPGLASLADPAGLLTTLALTGYYPVVGWAGFLLAGLAVARAGLPSGRAALRLAGAGAVLAGAAGLVGALLLGPAGGAGAIAAADPQGWARITAPGASAYGTTPTTTWWWLAVAVPHSYTPVYLVSSTGTALLALGLALALPAALTRWLGPLTAVGSMPLSVYALHVLAWPLLHTPPGVALGVHLVVACVLATAWRQALGRGPAEEVVGAAAGLAGSLVGGRPRGAPALRR